MADVSVLGSGAWGTALANVCARAGRSVLLWGRDPVEMELMDELRLNTRRLPGAFLEPSIRCISDLAQAARSDVLLAAVPAQAFRGLAAQVAALAHSGAALVICAKGIERSSRSFLTDVSIEVAPDLRPAILSGPSFAHDVAAGLPTAVTLAAADAEMAEWLTRFLATPSFRLYRSTDVRGVEIGGAAKNVLAIACGAASGRGLGASALAALVARGFSEIRRYGEAFGALPETLMGLSGLGDVVLTCGSAQSRNFALGVALGRGVALAQALAGELAEGAFTASVLVETAKERAIEMPIAEAVDAILAGHLSVEGAVDSLLSRPLRAER